jgi:hypothetical protein
MTYKNLLPFPELIEKARIKRLAGGIKTPEVKENNYKIPDGWKLKSDDTGMSLQSPRGTTFNNVSFDNDGRLINYNPPVLNTTRPIIKVGATPQLGAGNTTDKLSTFVPPVRQTQPKDRLVKSTQNDILLDQAKNIGMSDDEIEELKASLEGRTVKPSMKIPTSMAEVSESTAQSQRTITSEQAMAKLAEIETASKETAGTTIKRELKSPEQFIPFLGTAADYFKLSTANKAAESLMAGKPVSEKELEQLYNYIYKASVDKSFGSNVIEILSQVPAFAGEIAATGGLASGVKSASMSGLKRLLGAAVEGRLGSLLAKAGTTLAGAGVAALPIAGFKTPTGTIERQLAAKLTGEEESIWESATKAFGTQWVEAASERTGEVFNQLAAPIKGLALKTGLFNLVKRLNPLKTNAQISKFFDTFGYSGVFGEMFEERVADVGHAALGNEKFKLPSGEQLLTELVAFSIPSAGGMAISSAQELTSNILSNANQIQPMPALDEGGTSLTPNEQPKANITPEINTQLKQLGWTDNQIQEFDQAEVNSIIKYQQKPTLFQEKQPVRESWEIKYYNELPISEKESLAARADKLTSEQIKKLPEYKKLELENKEWHNTHKGIMATSPAYKKQVELFYERYENNLKSEVLKDYPELVGTVQPPVTQETGQPEVKETIVPEKSTKTVPEPVPQAPESIQKPVEQPENVIGHEEQGIVPPVKPPETVQQPEQLKEPIPVNQVNISKPEELVERVNKQNIKGIKGKILNLPVIKQVGKLVNPIAVTDDTGVVMSAMAGMIEDQMNAGIIEALTTIKRQSVNIKTLFKLDSKGIVNSNDVKQVRDLPEGKQSMALHDIVEYSDRYDFGTGKEAQQRLELIQAIREISTDYSNMLRNEGILVDSNPQPGQIQAKKGESDWVFLHRVVTQIKEESAEGVASFLTQTIKNENVNFARQKGETDYQYVLRFAESVSNGTIKSTTKIDNLLKTFSELADVDVKKSSLSQKRKWETVYEGLKGGTTYDTDIINELRKQIRYSYELIKKNRIAEIVKRLLVTTTPKEMAESDLRINADELNSERNNASNLVSYLQRAARGESLPGGVIAIIRKNFPEIGKKLDEAYKILPRDRVRLIRKAMNEAIKASTVTGKDVINTAKRAETLANIKLAFKKFGEKPDITISDIEDVLKQTISDKRKTAKAVKNLYLSMAEEQKSIIKGLVTESKTIKENLDKQWAEYQDTLKKYADRMGQYGTVEYGSVPGVPGLSGRYIMTQGKTGQEIADDIRRRFGYMNPSGADVAVKAAGQVGAVARMSKLGFDMSAELIQMALALGFDIRNAMRLRPTATWAKSTGGVIKTLFSKNMQHLDAFLDSKRDIVIDFVSRGGLVETGEAVEGVEPVQKLIEKLKEGKVKEVGGFISKHILGRSEAIFTTGRVMAAVNMYEAGYHAAERAGKLNEWALLVNKMTGVISTRAMGVSAGQRSIESAFGFMSPRFTRASGAIIADILTNPTGYTAKQAGTSLVALIAAWTAIAFAVNGSDDKETQLNPTHPDFLKIYIGDRYYRIGGIINDIRRLTALVDSLAYMVSGKHISLSGKEDNTDSPDKVIFEQFKGKTSPVTGTAIDIIRMLTDENATDFDGNKLSWKEILGDWISPAWTDALLNSELDKEKGAAGEFIGLTSVEQKSNVKNIEIQTSITKLGTQDTEWIDNEIIKAEKAGYTEAKIQEIKDEGKLYDITSLRTDISKAIEYLNEKEIKELESIAQFYSEYKVQDDEFNKLSEEEQKQYIADNPEYYVNKLFWGKITTIETLEQATQLADMLEKYDIEPEYIPAFQLTDKGREKFPLDDTLWDNYFEYYDLPSTSILSIKNKEDVPAEYIAKWSTYQNLKTDIAKSAFKRANPKLSYGNYRQDYRRKNPDLDKWLVDNEHNKALPKKTTSVSPSGSTNRTIKPVSSTGFSSMSASASPRTTTRKSYPKFKKTKVSTSMRIYAPRVRSA